MQLKNSIAKVIYSWLHVSIIAMIALTEQKGTCNCRKSVYSHRGTRNTEGDTHNLTSSTTYYRRTDCPVGRYSVLGCRDINISQDKISGGQLF